MKKTVKYFINTLTVLIIIFTLYIAIFGSIAIRNNKLINIFGYSYGFVPTSSMDGEQLEEYKVQGFKKGSIIIIKKEDYNNLDINDVIVYKSNANILIVHRIIEKEENGELKYLTKGDNNEEVDNEYVTNNNYEGKVVSSIYMFGLFTLLSSIRGVIIIVILLILLVMMILQIYNLVKVLNVKKQEEENEKEIERIVNERLKELK